MDYVLTVAVSMSSAAAYLTTAVPSLHGQQALIATVGVVILALVNLRGIKEAGSVFAVPTYIFMASILGMTAVGIFQAVTGQLGQAASADFTIVPASPDSTKDWWAWPARSCCCGPSPPGPRP